MKKKLTDKEIAEITEKALKRSVMPIDGGVSKDEYEYKTYSKGVVISEPN